MQSRYIPRWSCMVGLQPNRSLETIFERRFVAWGVVNARAGWFVAYVATTMGSYEIKERGG